MKVSKIVLGIGIVSLFGIASYTFSQEAEAAYYPTVNAITEIAQSVVPTSEITYLDDAGTLQKGHVTWSMVSEDTFKKAGAYKVTGVVNETNAEVKGIINVFDSTDKINVAAVGDSITYGMNVESVALNAYPKQLNNRLGVNYVVTNFGNSGKTLLETGNDPYIRTAQYKNSLTSNPNVVVIQLGTNDSKPANFTKIANYVSDYVKLIKDYKNLATKPVVYVSLPPKVFSSAYTINQGNLEKILPLIMQAASEANLDISVIDNQSATTEISALIPDGVHPNAKGAAVLANNVYHTLVGEQSEKSGKVSVNQYDRTFGAINSVYTGTTDMYLGNIGTDNWVSYQKINFDTNVGEILLSAAVPYNNTTVEVHLDSPTGPVIGKQTLTQTGNVNIWKYHTIKNTPTTGVQDVYFVFSRPTTAVNVEIARLGTIDFSYDSTIPFAVYNASDFETALADGFTNIVFMADINLTKQLSLTEDTKIDLNGFSLNTGNYFLTKNEYAGKRITLDIFNGSVTGNSAYGSIYAANSEALTYGMDINVKDIHFSGVLFIRNNVKDAVVTFDGNNVIASTKGSNLYARNITFKENSTYSGTTQGGGSSDESGSSVITMGTSTTTKNLILEKNAQVELYPGTTGTGYGQNAIFGFSSILVKETASLKASGKQPMLRTLIRGASVKAEKESTVDLRSTESAYGVSFSYGIDYVFDHLNYLNLESSYAKRNSFIYAYQNSSITILADELYGWSVNSDLSGLASNSWHGLESFQLSTILNGKNMGTITQGTPEMKDTFGSLNNYYRLSNKEQ